MRGKVDRKERHCFTGDKAATATKKSIQVKRRDKKKLESREDANAFRQLE